MVLGAGIAVLVATIYGHSITSARAKVLSEGHLIRTVVADFSYGKNFKTLYVEIDGKRLDAGKTFGTYENSRVGDSISVRHIPGIELWCRKENKITKT